MDEPSGWRLRTEYTFGTETTIEQLDQIVGGRPRGGHGGISHSIGSGPWRALLEWEFPSFEEAKRARDALDGIPVVAKAHLVPPRGDRVLNRAEYEIRTSDARAGRAICVSCGHRIALDLAMEFALQGVGPGNEVVLRCGHCGLPMAWVILREP